MAHGPRVPHDALFPSSPNWYCSHIVDCSRDGVCALGAKNTIHLLDVAHRSFLTPLTAHRARVTSVHWLTCEGYEHVLTSGAADRTVRVWDTTRAVVLAEHRQHKVDVLAVAPSPLLPNLIASGDKEGHVIAWKRPLGDDAEGSTKGSLSFRSCRPTPSAVFTLAFAPRTESLVAVGFQNGIVTLVDVWRGTVLRDLSGHNDEIQGLSWCPSETTHDDLKSSEEDLHLPRLVSAAGGRDRTLRIWEVSSRRCITTLALPKPPQHLPEIQQRTRLWAAVAWDPDRPDVLVSAGFNGDLVQWTLHGGGGSPRRFADEHTRPVFSIAFLPTMPGRMLSVSMDRSIRLWDVSSRQCVWNISSLGGSVYAVASSSLHPEFVAIAVGDKTIRVWNTHHPDDPFQSKMLWKGIQAKVTALAWHPAEEGILAFGTDEGHVGMFDVFAYKCTTLASHHKGTVYEIGWGPSMVVEEDKGWCVYTCGGDGRVLVADPQRLDKKPVMLNDTINDAKRREVADESSPRKSGQKKCTDLGWNSDLSLLALGWVDGTVDVFNHRKGSPFPSLHLLCTGRRHTQLINRLMWNPGVHSTSTSRDPDLARWLASASDDGLVCVIKVPDPSEIPEEEGEKDRYRLLQGHGKPVTGLSWSPHHPTLLASASYDGTVQVWNAATGEALANFRGHDGRVFCVMWSQLDPRLMITGSEDQTVRTWNLERKTFTSPPSSRPQHDENEKDLSPPFALSGEGERVDLPDAKGVPSDPTPATKPSTPKKKKTTAKPGGTGKQTRNLLPLSTLADESENRMASISACLAAAEASQAGESGKDIPWDRHPLPSHASLDALISSPRDVLGLLAQEGAAHREADRWNMAAHLDVWKGNIGNALRNLAREKKMSSLWLGLAPLAGMDVWMSMCAEYARQLIDQGDIHTAALCYLACHKVRDAIHTYANAGSYREAVALARIRLLPRDPLLLELLVDWAGKFESQGLPEQAAKCYLAAGLHTRAIDCLASRGDLEALQASCQLSLLVDDATALPRTLRYGHALLRSGNLVKSEQVLGLFPAETGHLRVLCAVRGVMDPCGTGTPWDTSRAESGKALLQKDWPDAFQMLTLWSGPPPVAPLAPLFAVPPPVSWPVTIPTPLDFYGSVYRLVHGVIEASALSGILESLRALSPETTSTGILDVDTLPEFVWTQLSLCFVHLLGCQWTESLRCLLDALHVMDRSLRAMERRPLRTLASLEVILLGLVPWAADEMAFRKSSEPCLSGECVLLTCLRAFYMTGLIRIILEGGASEETIQTLGYVMPGFEAALLSTAQNTLRKLRWEHEETTRMIQQLELQTQVHLSESIRCRGEAMKISARRRTEAESDAEIQELQELKRHAHELSQAIQESEGLPFPNPIRSAMDLLVLAQQHPALQSRAPIVVEWGREHAITEEERQVFRLKDDEEC